jgi:DNA-binding helix-hairpin-helix protein with protein kinase domain
VNVFFLVILCFRVFRPALEFIICLIKTTWKNISKSGSEARVKEEWNSRRRKVFRRSSKVRHFKHRVKGKGKFFYKRNVIERSLFTKMEQFL